MSDAIGTMAPTMNRVRAYFAPVDRSAAQPTIFDPAQLGTFDLDAPPTPWLDLGWIENFTRRCETKIDPIRGGTPATTLFQVRTEIEATVSFSFESWGKLQLALAAGSQQMNLLKVASGVDAAGSGGTALPATPLESGSTMTVLQVDPTAASSFAEDELVAVDVDYAAETGFVGSGVSGAYVKVALSDVDYIRRVTLNVARIASINETTGAITLGTPLIAGAPTSSMKVSAVQGFCDREGSSFFQEWSALFVGEGQQGERVLWHYPRLQAVAGAAETASASPGAYEKQRLTAAFRALPVKDAVDGETVVCFRSYVAG